MAFRYCQKCNNALDKPTIAEDLISGQICNCGKAQPQWQSTEEWLVELDERLRELESKLESSK